MLTLHHRLPATVAAPSEARRIVQSLVSVTSPDVIDRARLVVSELVTHSVKQPDVDPESSVDLRVIVTRHHLRLEVEDHGTSLPIPERAPDPADSERVALEPGADRERWLLVVEQVSDAWGTLPGGIWAEMNWQPEAHSPDWQPDAVRPAG